MLLPLLLRRGQVRGLVKEEPGEADAGPLVHHGVLQRLLQGHLDPQRHAPGGRRQHKDQPVHRPDGHGTAVHHRPALPRQRLLPGLAQPGRVAGVVWPRVGGAVSPFEVFAT